MTKKIVVLEMERELANDDIEMVKVKIKKMKTRQLNHTMKVVTKLMAVVDESPAVKSMIFDMYQGGRDFDETPYKEEGMSKEEIQEEKEKFMSMKDNQFMEAGLKSFRVLFSEFPDLIVQVLSAVSKIDEEELLDQEPEFLFDVFDAIVAVNDMSSLINRAKKSSFNIQTIMGEMFKDKNPEGALEEVAVPQQ